MSRVMSDTCSKLLRRDSHILLPKPNAFSAISPSSPVASSWLQSRVGWTRTYYAGTALSRRCIFPRYRPRSTSLSNIPLHQSERGQTTARTWRGSYMRPRPGWTRIRYGARTKLVTRSRLCTSLDDSATHGSHSIPGRPSFFSLASTKKCRSFWREQIGRIVS